MDNLIHKQDQTMPESTIHHELVLGKIELIICDIHANHICES